MARPSERWLGIALGAALAASPACTALAPGSDRGDGGNSGQDTGGFDSGDVRDTGAPDAPPSDAGNGASVCPPLAERTHLLIDSEITESVRWTCDHVYEMQGLIYVRAPSVLTIDAGTFVVGQPTPVKEQVGAGLVVERGARLEALGTAIDPIVFSSGASPRARGDWAGIILMGAATINRPGGVHSFEGLNPLDPRNEYGGGDDAHDCGTLRYVRIEFAGDRLEADQEINGLSLAACGSQTEVDFVHVHMGFDDGLEIFGGTVDVQHVIVSRARDDLLDWDQGWRGRGQFIVLQQDSDTTVGERGIEADNLDGTPDAMPRSAPALYNVTLIGSHTAGGPQTGMVLRRGTWGTIRNSIVMGYPAESIDVQSAETAAGTGTGELTVENTIFFEIGPGGSAWFNLAETDDDGMFNEPGYFADAARMNRFGDDPMLGAPYDLLHPSFRPAAGGPATTGFALPPADGFFDRMARHLGAVAAGGEDWTQGWTSYPLQ